MWVVLPVCAGAQVGCDTLLRLQVLEYPTALPLPSAQVHQHFADGQDLEYLTNLDGVAYLDGCRGPFTLHIDLLGYESRDIPSDSLGTNPWVVYLYPTRASADEVIVTGQATTVRQSVTAATLQGTELARYQGGTLADALEQLPGVVALRTGPTIAKPVVHGQQGSRVVLLMSGVRQEAQQWGSEHGPEIDPFLATQLTVVKGPAALRYGGDAIGGVVLVEPPSLPTRPGLGAVLQSVGATNGRLVAQSARIEGAHAALPGWAWRLQGTYRRAGDVKTPDYYLRNTGLEEVNFSVATGYRANKWSAEVFFSQFESEVGILAFAHIGNLSDLQRSIEAGAPIVTTGYSASLDRPYQDIRHRLFKARADYTLGPQTLLRLTYAWQVNRRAEYDLHRSTATDRPELDFTITTHTLDLGLAQSAAPGRTGPEVSAGVVGLWQQNTWSGRFLIPFYYRAALGAYTHATWRLHRHTLSVGGRYEWQELAPEFNDGGQITTVYRTFHPVTGALGWSYLLAPDLTLQADLGLAVRAPYANELYSEGVHHGSGIYERGDPNLASERALKASLGLELAPNPNVSGLRRWLSGTLQLYRDQVLGYIVLEGLPEPILTIRGAFPSFFYSQSEVTFYGADLALRAAITPQLSYRVEASWLRSRDASTGYAAPLTPADRYRQMVRYELGTPLKGLSGAYLELSSLAVSRSQGFAPYGALRPASPEFVTATRDYAPPPPGYHLLGVALGATVHLGPKVPLEVSLIGDNLFDTAYRDYLDRFRYYVLAPGRNVRLQLRIPLGTLRS